MVKATRSSRQPFPLGKVYGLLEPGPVILLTTAANGQADVMTQSWHMMVEFEPPLVACIVSGRNHSFDLLRASGECGINIPTVELAERVVACGNTTGREIDKFAHFHLKTFAGGEIAVPLLADCYANLECRVVDETLVDRYNLFILEVVAAWRDEARADPRTLHHQGWGSFRVDGELLTLPSKMK